MGKIATVAFFCIFLCAYKISAQNLINNNSFEQSIKCPLTVYDFEYAVGWGILGGTPDYFNPCSGINSAFSVPNNYMGTRSTFSGLAYAGICVLGTIEGFSQKKTYLINEAIYTRMQQPMEIGRKYTISFLVSLADSSYFSTDSLYCSFSEEAPVFDKKIKNFGGPWKNFKYSKSYGCSVNFAIKGKWNEVRIDIISNKKYRYFSIGLPRSLYPINRYNTDLLNPRLKSVRLSDSKEKSAYYYIDNINIYGK